MIKRTKTIMLALITLFILAGCGQKGPLYLPDEPEQTDPDATSVEESTSVRARVEHLLPHTSV
ncbi:cell envelope biogenesis protein OmpA [Aliidiomarina halalkaliphila]|uniref:Cell envelope biogenesis protein OmpA n=1 Tax=Aliidiomarina halalkaliphila TaxID=2593535 RepID=A0A552X083_9GAMM|nr:lipoprotein [Aliidiomarina halalkaliphila]TRW48269.1 cell envelope biogenesis protein OmpA [Aliidiomarina halalkaliphila]